MSEPELSKEVALFGTELESGERSSLEARDYLWKILPPKIAALESRIRRLKSSIITAQRELKFREIDAANDTLQDAYYDLAARSK